MPASPPDRISQAIGSTQLVLLPRISNPALRGAAAPIGPVDPDQLIHDVRVVISPSLQQRAALTQLLEDQRNPGSPEYHKWLTPEQFGERFGASEIDLTRLSSWLREQGFNLQEVARARNWIKFDGSASQIEKAFHTQLRNYEIGGQVHFSNAGPVFVPAALSGFVADILGLDDFHPRPNRLRPLRPDFNSSSGAHYLAPDDLAAIYDISPLYVAGFDGTGQKLAIAGQTQIRLSDLRGFRSSFNLPARDPQLVLTGSDPGLRAADWIEATLDLEWSGAVARNATIVYVYSPDVFESLQYIVDQDLAPVMSLSYGGCELGSPLSYRTLAQQANAEGITWMNSSGDSGAAGCDYDTTIAGHGMYATFPANIPEVTAVGGTEFAESGNTGWNSANGSTGASVTGYLPETSWNDTPKGSGVWASGGGASTVFAKPWWQTGPGVPNDNARDVPDISLTASGAHDGYLIFANGGLMSVGGTSASSPSFAGIISILNQYVVSKGAQATPGVGNINPNLYALAQTTTGIIHDITTGNNVVPCAAGSPNCSTGSFGYQAGPGFDLVTGLGSVDANNLVTGWTNLPAPVGTALSLAASPAAFAQTAGTVVTATVTALSGSNAPTGSVSLSAGGVALGSTTLAAGSGGQSTASLNVKGSVLSTGVNTISASFSPLGAFSGATGSTAVTVNAVPVSTSTTLTASPAGITMAGTTQLTATVTAAMGATAPTGSVTFLSGATYLGTATLASSGAAATATLSVPGSKLVVGSNAVSGSFTGTGNFMNSSSNSATVTVSAPLIATTITASANPVNLTSASGSTVIAAVVRPAGGSAMPSGNVTFTLGTTSLGSANLTNTSAGPTAAITVKAQTLAAGANTITANYTGNSNFSPSSGPLSVTVTLPPAATTTTLSASPSIFAQTGSTQLTATVKVSSGAVLPSGSVTFSAGNTVLGSASLSSASVGASASLTISGSALSVGNNTVKASYNGGAGFASSSASATLSISAAPAATAAAVSALPATIAPGGSTTLTATVKPSSGATLPTGTVSFLLGSTNLGSATLAASGGTATATLTLKSSSLSLGGNRVTANYPGSINFAASSGTAVVTLSAPTASNVVATLAPFTSNQPGFGVKVQLQETAGVATSLTALTINGTDFSSVIASMFGSNQIAANGTLNASPIVQWVPLPSSLVFVFTGKDASGRQWTQTASIATKH